MYTRTVVELAKQIGSFTAVLYAFGFLAVHARLNALGVWSRMPLIDEQYLTEGALFLVSSLFSGFFPFGLIALLAVSVSWWGYQRLSEERIARLSRCAPRAATLQVLALIALAFSTLHFAAHELGTTGLLLPGRASTSNVTATGSTRAVIYGALVTLTMLAVALVVWMHRKSELPGFFTGFAAALALLLVVLLPLNYAVLLRTSEFPVMEIKMEQDESVRGALLLRAADQIVVYDLQGGILTLPAEDVATLRIERYVDLSALRSGTAK